MKVYFYILTFLCLLIYEADAQDSGRFNDSELWLSLDLKKELSKDLDFTISEAVRFDKDISEFKVLFTQASLKYRLFKPLTLTAAYRYSSDERFRARHRMMFATQYRQKLKRFNLSWRLRYEREYEQQNPIQNRIRNRIKASYSKKKSDFDFFLAFETFYTYNYIEGDINRERYIFGIDYKVSKSIDIGLSGIFQREINTARPFDDAIINIGLSYEL